MAEAEANTKLADGWIKSGERCPFVDVCGMSKSSMCGRDSYIDHDFNCGIAIAIERGEYEREQRKPGAV